jgi:type I restriction enzyme M protein
MRHFATESGKSKGQFYTPAEVSRVITTVIGISPTNTKASTTAYDPTCGSGSLLLKVAAQAGKKITLEGQEMDVITAGLARMNMILHDFPTANILSGYTLANPKFNDGPNLRAYDYVVANPPFSVKTWSTGVDIEADSYQRFGWGVPPAKQGDYAFLLHIIRSLKSTGKGACILPHASSSGAMPRPSSVAISSAPAISRASSACLPTCSMGPAYRPAFWCSTKRTPRPARASS